MPRNESRRLLDFDLYVTLSVENVTLVAHAMCGKFTKQTAAKTDSMT